MYINSTTAEERLIIARAVDDVFGKLERAHRMLITAWEDKFGYAEPKEISAYEAENLGDLLYVVDDIIFQSLLEYALIVGNKSAPGVQPHLDGAGRAVRALKVEDLKSAIIDKVRQMKPQQRDEVHSKCHDILKLPDEQAAPALEALLKETGAAV